MDRSKNEFLKDSAMSISEIKETFTYQRMCELKNRGESKSYALVECNNDEDLKIDDELKIGQLGMISRYVYDGISNTSYMRPTDMDKINELNKKVIYPSRFLFLMCHYGLRVKELSVLLAPTGAGKSTLSKSITLEISENYPVLQYLTEEDPEMYGLLLNRTARKIYDGDKAARCLANIKTVSELEISYNGVGQQKVSEFKERIINYVKSNKVKAIIFDNFSTSVFSDVAPDIQAKAFKTLKEVAHSLNIAILVLIHPTKTASSTKHELCSEDIRGNSAIKNIASYIYILKNCFNLDPKRAFIKVEKARNHSRAAGKYFELEFEYLDQDLGYYKSDKFVSRDYALEFYKSNK